MVEFLTMNSDLVCSVSAKASDHSGNTGFQSCELNTAFSDKFKLGSELRLKLRQVAHKLIQDANRRLPGTKDNFSLGIVSTVVYRRNCDFRIASFCRISTSSIAE